MHFFVDFIIISCYNIWYRQFSTRWFRSNWICNKLKKISNYLVLLVKSLVLVCIMTISGFFRIFVFKWSHISVVASGWFLTFTLKDSFDKPYWSIPFKIGSPIIFTAFLFAAFSYLWLWSKFFSSFFLSSPVSLLWFSFNRFGFIFFIEVKLWNN